MNLCVAHGASLIFRVLHMKRGDTWHGTVGGCRMALQAEQVHLADPQEAWGRRSVRRMATRTALLFDGLMLEDKRTHGVAVTIGADGELSG